MSVKIMTMVWEHAPCHENPLIILLALADWANDEGLCWPSMQKLADKARIDKRSARRIIRKLIADGLVTIAEEGGGRAKQNIYRVETGALCPPIEKEDIRNADTGDTKRGTLEAQKGTLEAQRGTFPAQKRTPVSPDPLVEPSVEPSEDPPREPPSGLPYHGEAFIAALANYELHRKEIRKPLRDTGRQALLNQLALYGEQGATRALITSVANGWTGVFEPRNGNGHRVEGLDAVREVLAELEAHA